MSCPSLTCLLLKALQYGFSAKQHVLSWFSSFLENRSDYSNGHYRLMFLIFFLLLLFASKMLLIIFHTKNNSVIFAHTSKNLFRLLV